jgi:ribosomal protein S18 acetylase RimI-like enzyme
VNPRSVAERQEQWRGFVSDEGYGRDRFLVLLEEGGIAGFAGGGPQRHGDPEYPGEIWSIYLLGSHRRRGHGRHLLGELARRMAPRYPALIVWTFALNAPARAFYERMGGGYVRTRSSGSLDLVGYGWRDTARLLESIAPPAGS